MTEEEFRTQLDAKGYGQVRTNSYEPNHDAPMHSHEFSAMLMVTDGEFILAKEGGTETFTVGQMCEVPAGTVHTERTGSLPATVLAGRK